MNSEQIISAQFIKKKMIQHNSIKKIDVGSVGIS